MARWRYLLLSIVGALVAAVSAHAAPCAQPLRIAFLDAPFPPMLMGSGPEIADPPGWSVLAMRDAARRMGCTLDIQRLPPRRLELLLETGQLDLGLFLGPTPERLKSLRFPVDARGRPNAAWAPLFGHLVFYAPAGSPQARSGAWDGRTLAAGLRVGVVLKSTQDPVARERGWPLEHASSFDIALQMMRAKRFELLLTPREVMRAELVGPGGELVELSPMVQRLPYFVAASPRLQETQPELLNQFWREACAAVRRVAPEARPADCGASPGG